MFPKYNLIFQPVNCMDEEEKIAYASEFYREMSTSEFSYKTKSRCIWTIIFYT